ncbi:hypothetical protein NMD63_05565 [Edwardsiella tarda]|uniref:hypothetical protein n=1 Tax=Edwardsiella tarda TaxID=636 RepID=UPI00351C68C8
MYKLISFLMILVSSVSIAQSNNNRDEKYYFYPFDKNIVKEANKILAAEKGPRAMMVRSSINGPELIYVSEFNSKVEGVTFNIQNCLIATALRNSQGYKSKYYCIFRVKGGPEVARALISDAYHVY